MKRFFKRIVGKTPKIPLIGSAEANQLVRDEMAEQNDNARAPRPIRHLVYPLRGADIKPLNFAVDLLTAKGLHVSEAEFGGGLIAEHEAVVAAASFDHLTDALREELAELGYKYDGWECPIYKGGRPR